GTSLLTPRGTLALVAPGDVHSNRKASCHFRCAFLDLCALQNAVEQFVERPIPSLSFRSGLIDDRRSAIRFLRAHHSLETVGTDEGRDDVALSFLHQLAVRYGTPHPPLPAYGNEDFAIRRTKRFLDERYAECISLRQLAQLTGLSAYHLN